jgi:hypothetical protein
MEGFFIVLVSVGIPVAGLVALVVLPIWVRERTKQSANELLREAIAKGQTIDPEVLKGLADVQEKPKADRPRRTLGSALVLIALSAGFIGANYLSGDFTGGGMLVPAMILGSLGVAFLILAIVDYSAKKKTDV